ncbi:site-specific integrase [Alteromonas sp. KUL49]|nr:site-specific integrase [Alteromonas sp. KUL49]
MAFSPDDIARIKVLLADQPRNLCLFTLGINSAYRANELLSLTVGQVRALRAGDVLDIKQSKTNQYRIAVLNSVSITSIDNWLVHHPSGHLDHAPLFLSLRRRDTALSVSAVNNLVKSWCGQIKAVGNFGSYTLRKTWGYHQRIQNRASIALLIRAFGHRSEAQTLDYMCISSDEIKRLYMEAEL